MFNGPSQHAKDCGIRTGIILYYKNDFSFLFLFLFP